MSNPQPDNVNFTRLWVKAQPLVTSYVFAGVRRSHDAEDLLQEIAAAALTDFADYDAQRPFTPWVLGIARHRILNYYRQHASEKLQFNDAALAALAVAHEQLEAQTGLRRHALNQCLQQLAERKQTVLRMRYAQDIPVQDIATSLSTTANAISLLLHKVRKSLAKCVERQLAAEGRQ